MASKSTGRKKTSTKKKTAAGRSGRTGGAATRRASSSRSSARTSTAKKKTTKNAKKVSTKKKTTSRSQAAKKKTAAKPRRTTSKKKKKAAVSRKKTGGKSPGERPTSGDRKETRKKKAAKEPAAKAQDAKAQDAKAAGAVGENGKKKRVRKRSESSRGAAKRGSGRSVAEVASGAEADEKGYVFINGRRVRMITTSGKAPVKRSRAETTAAAEQAEPQVKKQVKTHLTRKQLNYYRNLLLIKRAELVGDLSSLEAEALRSSGGNLSHMPIHMADIGSDTYEQDFMLGLAETERKLLREIDAALQRIEESTYGVCQMTGDQIPDARLEAKPWAMYTVEAARQLERGWSG